MTTFCSPTEDHAPCLRFSSLPLLAALFDSYLEASSVHALGRDRMWSRAGEHLALGR